MFYMREKIEGQAGSIASEHSSKPSLDLAIVYRRIEELKPDSANPRRHGKKQIRQIADSIEAFGFLVPILIDEAGLVIAGHGRYAAAKLLGLKQVPIIEVTGLSEAKRRALALADNRIAEGAGWDREMLAAELVDEGKPAGVGCLRNEGYA